VLVALGCDSLADAPHDMRSPQPSVGGTQQGTTNGAGGTTSFAPPVLIVDVPVVEPEPNPDWCTVANQEGATFCEERTEPSGRVLEYCEPAPGAPPIEGGAAGMAGADAGAAGADAGASAAGAAGADAGTAGASAAGAAGADAGTAGASAAGGPGTGQPAECVNYDRPPEWVYDLLIQCYAHCGVGIRMSQRKLEGSCCYLAQSEYYGR
jgi:hypothetical protein